MAAPFLVNASSVEEEHPAPDPERFARKRLGRAAGGDDIGCSLYRLPPGGRSWPYHYHTANEEAIYVLAGTGTLRTPEGEVDISVGDYVAFPTGEMGAHQVRNDGDDDLRYLCVSTMVEPEVNGYPDAGSVGIFVGAPPGGDHDERTFQRFLDVDAEAEYWD